MRVLQLDKTLEGQNQHLYNHYLYGNQSWPGALALLDQPMDKEPETKGASIALYVEIYNQLFFIILFF